MNTQNLPVLKIHKLTQKQYEDAAEAGNIEETALYLTPEADHVIEVGTSEDGLWYYRKWASGRAECWTKNYGFELEGVSSVEHTLPFSFRARPFVSVSHTKSPLGVNSVSGYAIINDLGDWCDQIVVSIDPSQGEAYASARVAVLACGFWK